MDKRKLKYIVRVQYFKKRATENSNMLRLASI